MHDLPFLIEQFSVAQMVQTQRKHGAIGACFVTLTETRGGICDMGQ